MSSDFWRVCRSKASRAVAVRNVGVLIFMIPGSLEPHQQNANRSRSHKIVHWHSPGLPCADIAGYFQTPVERRPKSWQASTDTSSQHAELPISLPRVSDWRWRPREGCD